MRTKKSSVTMKQLEDCLIQTIAAMTLLNEMKTKKKKPILSSTRFVFLVMSHNKKQIFDELTKWKTAAGEFIDANREN